jgi:hypothetical protein
MAVLQTCVLAQRPGPTTKPSLHFVRGRQEFPQKKALVFILFFKFFKKYFTAKFVVIGFKQGKLQVMGEKKKVVT